jgi:hypothetical protein
MAPQPHQQVNQELTAAHREVMKIAALLRKTPLDLKDYFAIGEQMRRLSYDTSIAWRGSNWRETLAKLVDCSPSTLTKALQFRLAYEAEKLPDLEELDVGWSWLTIALGVKDSVQRHALLRKAKEKRWGERELQRAIQQLKGGRRGGGRPRREMVRQGVVADVCELTRLTQLWAEFHDRVWHPGQKAYLDEIGRLEDAALANLPRLLFEAWDGVAALQRRCKEAIAIIASLRKTLPR